MFSHFGTVPACDRRTDRHTTTAYTSLAWRYALKINGIIVEITFYWIYTLKKLKINISLQNLNNLI